MSFLHFSFYTFGFYVKSGVKMDHGKYIRTIHMGKAKCNQPLCQAKGMRNGIAFTTQSRNPLKSHYENVSKIAGVYMLHRKIISPPPPTFWNHIFSPQQIKF